MNSKVEAANADATVKFGYIVRNGGGTTSVALRFARGWSLYSDPEIAAHRVADLDRRTEATKQHILRKLG